MAGFFDGYEDENPNSGDSNFLTAGEKQLLIDEGASFPITSVDSTTTQYGPRWVLGIEVEGESRMLGFGKGKVFSRDRLLAALKDHFEKGGEPVEVRIEMSKRSQIIVDANS